MFCYKGERVLCKTAEDSWYRVRIIETHEQPNGETVYKVHYLYWGPEYDEWVVWELLMPDNILTPATETKTENLFLKGYASWGPFRTQEGSGKA